MNSEKRKLLLVNNSYPSDRFPQASTYIVSIEDSLKNAYLDVTTIVIRRNSMNRVVRLGQHLWFSLKILCSNFGKYDFVYINHYTYVFLPVLIKILFKRKGVFFHWHGEDVIGNSLRERISRFLINLTNRDCFVHFVPSEYFKRLLLIKINTKEENVYVSPSGGVDIQLFQPSFQPQKDDSVVIIGFASGLVKSKGVDVVYEFLKRKGRLEELIEKKIVVHIIKYGKDQDYWSSLFLQEFKTSVLFINAMPKSKMVDFYNSIDVLLFPTKGESLGLVGLEAMSCGIPVLGTNDFALPEYIVPGISGELFDIENVEELMNKAALLINQIRNYIPRKLVVEKYSNIVVSENYYGLFNNALL